MEKATPYSNLKIFAHYKELADIGAGRRIAPVYIRIKPTNYCNHKCYYCSYADSELGLRDAVNKQDFIPRDKMLEILDDMRDMGVRAVTFSGGGEPLIYPFIAETMKKILEYKIDLSVITNGQLLKDERAEILSHAKWVRISFDSANAKTYAKTRRIPENYFDEVCENIKNFAKIKQDNCELGINFVINHENSGQVLDMARLASSLGVNHIKFCARVTKDLFEYHAPFKQKVIEQIHMAKDELDNGGGGRHKQV